MKKVLFAVGLMVAVACGPAKAPGAGDSGISDAGDAGVDAGPIVSACESSTQTRCLQLEMCEPGALTSNYGSVTTCETRQGLSCVNSQNASGTGQNTTNLQACSLAIASESCASALTGVIPPSCEPPIGMGATGSACVFDGQCQSQFCNAPPNAICGACAPQPSAGDPCSRTGCGLTLECVAGATNSLCAAPTTTSTCDLTHPCTTGNSYVIAAGADAGMRTMGTCEPFATSVGSVCSPDGHTAPECDHRLGLGCLINGAHGTCVQTTFVVAGAPCGQLDGGVANCEAAGNCQKATGQTEGICEAPIADGMSCDSSTGASCIPPAICAIGDAGTIGTCTVPNASQCM